MSTFRPLSNAEIADFCSQMALLFQAGIPPAECVNILMEETPSESGRKILAQIHSVVSAGNPLHEAIASTGAFPDYAVRALALGEESGNLDLSLKSLGEYYEKEASIRESFKSAVAYPIVMICMMLAVIFILVSKVLPVFRQVFTELGSDMSGFAATLLNIGQRLEKSSVLIIVLAAVLAVLILACCKIPALHAKATGLLRHLPFVRGFYDELASGRFAEGMGMCLKSGMDTFHSLEITRDLVCDSDMEAKIDACRTSLEQGDDLRDALVNAGIFGTKYSQMIAAGFQSGSVETVFFKIADDHRKSLDHKVSSLLSVIEPTLVIFLSVVVGMILLSVILPLMGIMSSIG